jgi:regulator of chromosome condensation
MVSRSANIGRKRTAPIEVSSAKSSKPSRSVKDDTYSNNDIAAGSMAPKRATAATSESKSTKRQSATKPTSKSITSSSTSKRPAEDETVSQPAKRQRSTKTEKAAPSAPKKVVRKPAPKKVPATKETKTTKAKTKITSESELNGIKHQKIQAAKKSPVEARKVEPEINAPPTEKLRVFACGEGSAGELGLGPKGREVKRPRYNVLLDPEKIGIVQMSAGGMHTVALTHDNKILTWGVNDQGALGRDTTWEGGLRDVDDGSDSESDDEDLNPKESTPLPIDASHFPKDTKFVQVAAGDSCSFVLTTTGYVYGWGTFRVS